MPLGLAPRWKAASLKRIPTLDENELHLWCLPLTLSDPQKETALDLLSDIQRERYHRRHTSLKSSYLAGRFYLLNLLAAYTKQDASDIKLSYTRLNKPYLSFAEGGISFNFTDTGGKDNPLAMFAFCRNREVGVDIEANSRVSNFLPIVKKRFTKLEQDYVIDDFGQVIPERFLAIWTRKEASGKATGQGINFKMNNRELLGVENVENLNHHHNYYDEHGIPWRLTQLNVKGEHIACVVHADHQSMKLCSFDHLLIE